MYLLFLAIEFAEMKIYSVKKIENFMNYTCSSPKLLSIMMKIR